MWETLAVLGLAVVGWGARLESRVNGQDIMFAEREKLAAERQDEILARLDRIERKQDAANGNGKH